MWDQERLADGHWDDVELAEDGDERERTQDVLSRGRGWCQWVDAQGGRALGEQAPWHVLDESRVCVEFDNGARWETLSINNPAQIKYMSRLMVMAVCHAEANARSREPERSREVCICGHPMTRHVRDGDGFICAPTRITCHCTTPRAVLTTNNLRLFLSVTRGVNKHALNMGMVNVAKRQGIAGKSTLPWWDWLEGEPRCDWCMRHDNECVPVMVNTLRDNEISVAKEFALVTWLADRFICQDCCTTRAPSIVSLFWSKTTVNGSDGEAAR